MKNTWTFFSAPPLHLSRTNGRDYQTTVLWLLALLWNQNHWRSSSPKDIGQWVHVVSVERRRHRSADKNRQSVNNLTIFIVIFYTPFYLWPKIEGWSLCAHFFALYNNHHCVCITTISNLALHSCNINKLLHGPFILVTETRTTSYLNS